MLLSSSIIPAFAVGLGLDSSQVYLVDDETVFQFGANLKTNATVHANSGGINTTLAQVTTKWFTINSSLLKPTIILLWAYNFTYKFAVPWINTTSPNGFASSYAANFQVNTSTISTGLKFYKVDGTYVTASPHFFSSNSTLHFFTAGNPTTVNIFASTSGLPTKVFANGIQIAQGAGWTYDSTNKIIHITHTGTFFGVSWQVSATENITLTISPVGAPNQGVVTISGCNPSPATIVIDGASHAISADVSCSITLTVTIDSTNARDRFSPLSSTWVFTTAASGSESRSNMVYHQLRNLYQATPVGPTVWDAAYTINVKGTVLGTASTNCGTIVTAAGGGAASSQLWCDYNLQATMDPTFGSTWTNFGPNTFTQTTGGNTDNVNYVFQFAAADPPDSSLWLIPAFLGIFLFMQLKKIRK